MYTPLPALSGHEFVRALRRAGFAECGGAPKERTMQRGHRAVVVPDVPIIDDDVARTLLASAGIAPSDFLELLDGSSGRMRAAARRTEDCG